ncbi:hypothetical protein HK098_007836 [Nowakowskiella sp. JEL0407]|nr:hypothetical protein HK098_007836 [Nowakowskiella sp. JEL0407]
MANYANPSTVAKDTNVIMCTYSDKDCQTLSGGVGYMTCSGSCNTKNCLKNPAGAQSYIFKQMPAVVTENPCLAGASSGGTGSSASPSPKASTGSSSSSTSGAKELKVSHVLLVALIAVSLIQMV